MTKANLSLRLLFSLLTATAVAAWSSPAACADAAAPPAAAPSAAAPSAVATPPAATPPAAATAQLTEPAPEYRLPDQHGMSIEYGYTYDPKEDLGFVVARLFAIYDYGTIWHNTARKSLRFKVEGALGSTVSPDASFIASANMFAVLYPWLRANQTFRPYVEGGIGVIYTGFRVKGEGLHYNFNPILGVGTEFPQKDGRNPFIALRQHHISNGNLNRDNRGVNTVVLQMGRYF